jgi:hypothetical protein
MRVGVAHLEWDGFLRVGRLDYWPTVFAGGAKLPASNPLTLRHVWQENIEIEAGNVIVLRVDVVGK